ncbi:GAF domain-containing protein [Dyadobacter pollutisoli]|uniref:GAF domain-containing protein n=1 Tax=Dyadobacter pollutisoli TaxID=2910158 RepID=A0A9E8NH15_9BACT|nr:GAF domain-containing protein [Dyadobacter pollutisoli]WAC14471.1 GAF domain-containing protein [Dyadobacter pollutisoli]
MKPLNLLIVAIRSEWLSLLEDSLSYAGYHFQIKQVNSKQSAIKAFHESKYDLLISNCLLPDGKITDLANVLGSQLPCLVMTEGHCPVTAERVLAVTETNYYINCSNKLGWIPALENTLTKWRNSAQQKIDQHNQNNGNLYKKVLARCEEELSAGHAGKKIDELFLNAFAVLLEVMDLSRIYLCTQSVSEDGTHHISKRAELAAPGVTPKAHFSKSPSEIPYFKRWNTLLSSGKPVIEFSSFLTVAEQQLFGRHDIQSLLAVPIVENGGWAGYIALEDTLNSREWTDAEISLIGAIAAIIQKKNLLQKKSSRLTNELLTSQV